MEHGSDDIVYDPLVPTVTLEFGTGALAESRTEPDAAIMTIRITADDQLGGSGVSDMQISTNSGFTGVGWQPYASRAQVSASLGDTIYVRVRDAVGNVSAVSSLKVTSGVVEYKIFLPIIVKP